MKFFLDTANLDEIKAANDTGCLHGVTTNPTLIAKEGAIYKPHLMKICEIFDGHISAEVTSTEADAMVAEAYNLAQLNRNIVVKLQMTVEGMKALKKLKNDFKRLDREILVNVTLIFSVPQGLLAALAGARYVSPFVGRLDDTAHEGMDVVRDLVKIFRNYPDLNKTRVLAASIRHPMHVIEAAKAGAHIATMPYGLFQQLFKHPLTDIGLARFLEDAKRIRQ